MRCIREAQGTGLRARDMQGSIKLLPFWIIEKGAVPVPKSAEKPWGAKESAHGNPGLRMYRLNPVCSTDRI